MLLPVCIIDGGGSKTNTHTQDEESCQSCRVKGDKGRFVTVTKQDPGTWTFDVLDWLHGSFLKDDVS